MFVSLLPSNKTLYQTPLNHKSNFKAVKLHNISFEITDQYEENWQTTSFAWSYHINLPYCLSVINVLPLINAPQLFSPQKALFCT